MQPISHDYKNILLYEITIDNKKAPTGTSQILKSKYDLRNHASSR